MAQARSNEEIIATLNDLIETCKDGEDGFRTAAERVADAGLRTLFHTYERQRAQFAAELQEIVERLGGSPEKSGSAGRAIHRGWMDIKPAVTKGAAASIVSEAERGEDQAVKSYREALGSGLPPDIRSVIERQFRQVREAHDRVRSLEQRRAA